MPKEEKSKSWYIPDIVTIGLFLIMLIIPFAFFFLLSQETNANFGFSEILFSIFFAIIVTIFLVWIKNLTKTRPYLALVIGIILLAAFEYSLFFAYVGPYTTTFAIITAVIVLIYIIFYFLKYRKVNSKPVDDFNDDLSQRK